MTDYRLMYDSDYLYAFHLQGRDATVEISQVKGGEVTGEGGRKTKKPLVYFKGKKKPLALNKTNGKAIAGLYGPDTTKWIGRLVTLYPTTTQFGGKEMECVRIRPMIPSGKADAAYDEQREPGSDG